MYERQEHSPASTGSWIERGLPGGGTAGGRRAVSDRDGGHAENIFASLVTLLGQYGDEETPYLSRPRPMFWGRYADYDHLARVKEWSAAGEDSE